MKLLLLVATLLSATVHAEWAADAEICRAHQLLAKQKKMLAEMKKGPAKKQLARDSEAFEKKLKTLIAEYEKTTKKPFDLAACGKTE